MHLRCLGPRSCGLTLNKAADVLAAASSMCPVRNVLLVIQYFVRSSYFRFLKVQRRQNSLFVDPEYVHLQFSRGSEGRPSWRCAVCFTPLRCRVPDLNLYLFRKRFLPSDFCHFWGKREALDHSLLSCDNTNDNKCYTNDNSCNSSIRCRY